MDYSKVGIHAAAFKCPHCKAYSQMIWGSMTQRQTGYGYFAVCTVCDNANYWDHHKLVYPKDTASHIANNDMPEDIKPDFKEAADISERSPRGAAALLRLAIQKLCKDLGESGTDLNKDIGNLVKKGLDPDIQMAMDSLRVIGNEQVHPGEIDLRDNPGVADSLFEVLNIIVDQMITRKKKIEKLYALLPETKKQGIERRDGQK